MQIFQVIGHVLQWRLDELKERTAEKRVAEDPPALEAEPAPVPACVEAANAIADGAMTFGKLGDPRLRHILEEEHTICRRVSLGAAPNVYYIV